MFFLTPKYRKEAQIVLRAARKLLRYRCDILPEAQIVGLREGITRLQVALRQRSGEDIRKETAKLHGLFDAAAPAPPLAGLRENTEVILVALVIALGVRAYFLQPFKIPTGSMQPTLYGVTGKRMAEPPPSWPVRVAEFALRGRTYVDVVADQDEEILKMKEVSGINLFGAINLDLPFFTSTDIVTQHRSFRIPMPMALLESEFGLRPKLTFDPSTGYWRENRALITLKDGQPAAMPHTTIKAGQPIVRGYADTGDQLFVDKFTYNFIRPAAGDVFVFKTTGIRGIQAPGQPSQYYIKRLAGTAGDTLRIAAPELYINGAVPKLGVFRRVMSCKDGYRGYSNPAAALLSGPEDVYRVPQKSYFALGDNSYNSRDSRYFGPVPEQNVVGRGLNVYWPFLGRWGLIR